MLSLVLKDVDHQNSVHSRLLDTALELFMKYDYNRVTTRELANKADTSPAMINYCFGSKLGLYEKMIGRQFNVVQQALTSAYSEEEGLNLTDLFLNYLKIDQLNPEYCKFLMKVLAYKEGPGYTFLIKLLDEEWEHVRNIVEMGQRKNQITTDLDIDVLRIFITSLSVFPYLLKDVLTQSQSMSSDNIFEKLAIFSASTLTESLKIKSL